MSTLLAFLNRPLTLRERLSNWIHKWKPVWKQCFCHHNYNCRYRGDTKDLAVCGKCGKSKPYGS